MNDSKDPVSPGQSQTNNSKTGESSDDMGFLWHLCDPEFSDITVLVGEKEKEYKLHRVILSQRSDFFKVGCKEGRFIEGNQRLIRLPDIEPDTFDIVVKWIYHGGYSLPDVVVTEVFSAVHRAADFLGLRSLKMEMLKQIISRLSEDAKRDSMDRTIGEPITLFHSIAENSSVSDWLDLRKLSDKIIPWYSGDHSLFNWAQQDLGSAVLVDSYAELLSVNFCEGCLPSLWNNNRGRCRKCTCQLEGVRKRENVGPPVAKAEVVSWAGEDSKGASK